MKAFINIPKRHGSCITTRNGALLVQAKELADLLVEAVEIVADRKFHDELEGNY